MNLFKDYPMSDKAIQHTLNIFKQVYRNLPPLVSDDVRREMKEKIEEIMADRKVTLEELEDFMIFYGKQIWPFVQAFEEIYHLYHEKLAEKIFLAKASRGLAKKYSTIKETGVKFFDIFSGALHQFFSHEERVELMDLLVSLKTDIRKHATQAVLTHEQGKYEEKIEKYGKMVGDINKVIQDLHKFANEEADDDLAMDIRDKVRAIEHSFAFLGPKISYREVLTLPEYYEGKKHEKKMRRIV